MPSNAPEGAEGFLSRRGFVAVAAGSAASALLSACALRTFAPPALGRHPAPPAVTPFVTPNAEFFMVAVDPAYRPPFGPGTVGGWSLELAGPGGSRRVGYAELDGRARHRVHHTLECIGNPVGGTLIGNAEWRVAPLRELLATVPGGTAGARTVMFQAMDGFYSSVALERAADDHAFVAVEMNGAPLPAEHGFPARVLLPDLYGKKQPRWLSRIVLQETAVTTSYWERRFWKGGVPVKTTARLDPPAPRPGGEAVELTGMAYAGARGVRAVEVSLDGGAHWVPCELVTPTRPHAWTLWRYAWPRPTPGRHTLLVRATDGSGVPQVAEPHGRWPSGATGYHRVQILL
ncbi:MAG TPA: molybdopterin-dependent oxidoreductase [Longimicrobiaceae bacterium]